MISVKICTVQGHMEAMQEELEEDFSLFLERRIKHFLVLFREMDEYVWDLSSEAKDRVKKEHDHAMDDMRYFVSTVLKRRESGGFVACTVERRR